MAARTALSVRARSGLANVVSGLGNLVQMLVSGGYRNGNITAATSVLNTDQWKWFQPRVRGDRVTPAPRTGCCIVAIRESIFLFGGLTEEGLSNELWVLDLDSLTWSQVRPPEGNMHNISHVLRIKCSTVSQHVMLCTGSDVTSSEKSSTSAPYVQWCLWQHCVVHAKTVSAIPG
jgi:hypothetical protein